MKKRDERIAAAFVRCVPGDDVASARLSGVYSFLAAGRETTPDAFAVP